MLAKQLIEQKDLAFAFLNTVLQQNENEILEEYNQSIMTTETGHQRVSKKYADLLLLFVEILCEKKFKNQIVDFVSRDYFPIDESLAICDKKGALEASAVLNKRKGLYKESVDLYVEVMVQHSAHKLIHTLFDVTFNVNDHNTANKHIIEFNNLLQQVIKICEKHGSRLSEMLCEDLWLHTIQKIFGIKDRVKAIMKKGAELDSSSEEEQTEEKENFDKFLASKN